MRKLFYAFFFVLLSCSLMAQFRTGNIYGKVVDDKGVPLPGVMVTLTGTSTGTMSSITSLEGAFRFISLSPGKDYTLSAELGGFKRSVKSEIIVEVGNNVNIDIAMEMGAISVEVIVKAQTPIVDSKKATIGMNVGKDILQGIPSARDPWVIMAMAPGVQIDRENIGGAESGWQSLPTGRGSNTYMQNAFSMDGAVIAEASSNIYYDMDVFEEINISIGGNDVSVQTGGIGINFVTKRGGNKLSYGGRFYVADEKFQANNLTPELIAAGVAGINKIVRNKDWGFNMGGPIIPNKLWFWGAYGDMTIRSSSIFAMPDDTDITVFTGKLNAQIIPDNRLEIYMSGHAKTKLGGNPTPSEPEGRWQKPAYIFGSPVFKIQDEHMFGDNLLVSLRYDWMDWQQFNIPMMDKTRTNLSFFDVTGQRYYGSTAGHMNLDGITTPKQGWGAIANYFNDQFLGVAHEIKVGVDFQSQRTDARWGTPGNITVNRNYNTPTVDLNGDSQPDIPGANFYRLSYYRPNPAVWGAEKYAIFFSDTVTSGRFSLILGLRFDNQRYQADPFSITTVDNNPVWTKYFTPQTKQILGALLPSINVPAGEYPAADGKEYKWETLSPRLGLTWDINGDGKSVAKLSFSQYSDFMRQGNTDFRPGGTTGNMAFWWQDNGNGVVDYSELYWHVIKTYKLYRTFDDAGNLIGNLTDAAGTFFSGYDPANPVNLFPPFRKYDQDAGSSRTTELILSFEKEIMADFALQLVGTYRKYDRTNWTLKYFSDKNEFQNQSWYVSAGKPPANIPGIGDTKDAKNHEWYYQSTRATEYSDLSWVKKRPDYYYDYFGLDLVANKRLSKGWMLNASLTLQSQAQHYGAQGYLDPTNMWAYNDTAYSPLLGDGSGKISQYIYSRWYFKMAGLIQLPWDFNISGTVTAREGYIIRESFRIINYSLPNAKSNSATLDMTPFGSERLSAMTVVNFRVEKLLRIGDSGKIWLMLDLFNALNNATVNRKTQRYWGTYYVYADSSLNRFVADPNYNKLNEILNPRILRLGVRFEF